MKNIMSKPNEGIIWFAHYNFRQIEDFDKKIQVQFQTKCFSLKHNWYGMCREVTNVGDLQLWFWSDLQVGIHKRKLCFIG